MKKRILTLALALTFILALVPAAAASEYTVVVPFGLYSEIYWFSRDGVAIVYNADGQESVIDTTGKIIVPFGLYDWIGDFSDGVAVVGNADGQEGVIDKTGRLIVPFGTYGWIGDFSSGVAVAENSDGQRGAIDTTGKIIVPFGTYSWIDDFWDGVAVVGNADGQEGVIDKTGRLIVPFGLYEGIIDFSDGVAVVGNADWQMGAIDKTGRLIVPFGRYSWIGYFSNGVAVVLDADGQAGVIGKDGNIIIPFGRYVRIGNFWGGHTWAENAQGNYGIIDIAGNAVVPFGRYDYIEIHDDGFATVGKLHDMSLIRLPGGAPPPIFGDLAGVSAEGLANIEFVFENGLMSGSGGNFMPTQAARNAQFLAILSRLAGAGVTDGSPWFAPYVDWARDFGIIEAGEFDADGDMAREDMALWLYRYITISGIELPSVNGKPNYNDIAGLSEEQRVAAEALFDWGIIRGSNPGVTFGTGGSSERVALANVLARFVRMLP